MPPLRMPVSLSRWPIRPSLGALGRKWAFPVIRDLYALGEARFTKLLRRNAGMSERILSLRLRDLRSEGLVERISDPDNPRQVSYRLTQRGLLAVPILEGLVLFGVMQLAADVFGLRGPPRPRSAGALHEAERSDSGRGRQSRGPPER